MGGEVGVNGSEGAELGAFVGDWGGGGGGAVDANGGRGGAAAAEAGVGFSVVLPRIGGGRGGHGRWFLCAAASGGASHVRRCGGWVSLSTVLFLYKFFSRLFDIAGAIWDSRFQLVE